MQLNNLRKDLKALEDKEKSKFLQGFFKTAEGQYGYGDIFLGISVPAQRAVAKKYIDLNFEDLETLLKSKIHEERLTALIILVNKYSKADEVLKKEIYKFYIKNAKLINNWDLVDASADKIVGEYLLNKDKEILIKLANSKDLWEKRISIVSTSAFIKRGENNWTYKIAEILLNDPHDLIQKAVGWMLRETGKRGSRDELVNFLKQNYKKMPRTMLRYSIEHFDSKSRIDYLKGNI